MINPLDAYRIYSSIQIHFQSDKYDYTKTRHPIRKFNIDSFQNRRDRYQFEKLARQFKTKIELETFCACWFYENGQRQWVGDVNLDLCTTYQAHRAYTAQLHHFFRRDLLSLQAKHGSLQEAFALRQGFVPKVISDVMAQKIIEKRGTSFLHTFTLANRQTNIISVYDSHYGSLRYYDHLVTPIKRFEKFITLNTIDDLKALRETFLEVHRETKP